MYACRVHLAPEAELPVCALLQLLHGSGQIAQGIVQRSAAAQDDKDRDGRHQDAGNENDTCLDVEHPFAELQVLEQVSRVVFHVHELAVNDVSLEVMFLHVI